MASYDAIVIGGGHNGLVSAAYLARAGKKVLVLERRHVLGGAAVTEEVFPGFRFSVCSYVVSLLRPEIIRELDLPRHGLEILPLDGTFTPMPNGDHLWRMSDHAKTRREIYRHSPTDAEAYDEYAKAMVEMARFVKPILSMVPPDPFSYDVKGLGRLGGLGLRFQKLSRGQQHSLLQLMTMSAADLLDQWFETDVLKATMSASGIIGTFLGVRSPGTAYVLLHHYMGEIDGAFRSWGFSRGGTGRDQPRDRGRRARGGRRDPHRGAGRADQDEGRPRDGRRAAERRRDRRRGRALERRPAHHVPEAVRAGRAPGRVPRGRGPLQVPGLLGQGQPRARRPAGLQVPARPRRAPARGDVDLAERRVHGARLRRRQVRRLLAPALHRHRDPVAHRPLGRPARQARAVVLRAVRALQAARGHLGREARGLRRHRDRHARRVRAEPQAASSCTARC